MEVLVGVFFFILGTIIGSFLNVVSLRYNSGTSFSGRSRCFSCNSMLRWVDLIPVLSFAFLRGKCAHCGSRISIQYPLVEVLSGTLFLLVYLKALSLLFTAFTLTVFSVLLVILVYDMRHKIIPDGLVWSFIGLSFFSLFTVDFSSFVLPSVIDLASGVILFFPFYLMWVFSRGTWVGLGDGKLALGIGWLFPLPFAFSVILLSFWAGAFVAVALLGASALNKTGRFGMKSELPFAPFLIGAVFAVFLLDINVLALLTLLFT